MKRTTRILATAVMLALAPVAMAQTTQPTTVITTTTTTSNAGQTNVATKMAASFTNLAGGQSNSLALVTALRTGSAVTFTTTTPPATPGGTPTVTTTSFTPPTQPM